MSSLLNIFESKMSPKGEGGAPGDQKNIKKVSRIIWMTTMYSWSNKLNVNPELMCPKGSRVNEYNLTLGPMIKFSSTLLTFSTRLTICDWLIDWYFYFAFTWLQFTCNIMINDIAKYLLVLNLGIHLTRVHIDFGQEYHQTL